MQENHKCMNPLFLKGSDLGIDCICFIDKSDRFDIHWFRYLTGYLSHSPDECDRDAIYLLNSIWLNEEVFCSIPEDICSNNRPECSRIGIYEVGNVRPLIPSVDQSL